MKTIIHQRVEMAKNGANPYVIMKMKSGWAVMGDNQFIHGYCLLLSDPVVSDLNELSMTGRAQFMLDMSLIGDALLNTTGSYRINYEILGNQEPALHAHIFPRYKNEPVDKISYPIWNYDLKLRSSIKFSIELHGKMMNDIKNYILNKSAQQGDAPEPA